MFATQVALAFLPNIEITSLLVILFTLVLKKRVFWIIGIFVLLEGLLYGFGVWWYSYIYVWAILAGITMLFRRMKSVLGWALLSGIYGLSFGLLTEIPFLLIGGVTSALGFWISGLLFDIIHCVGNIVVCVALFQPLRSLLERLNDKAFGKNENTTYQTANIKMNK
jgi:energy-coupling factor transport system substrate-specific component